MNYSNNLTRHAKQSAFWFSKYGNEMNPDADYIGPTLPPSPMPSGYALEVCPTPLPTEPAEKRKKHPHLNVLGIVFLAAIALLGLAVLGFLGLRGNKGRGQGARRVNHLIDDDSFVSEL